jgi:tetratricopeptide (TPR) repeat protein
VGRDAGGRTDGQRAEIERPRPQHNDPVVPEAVTGEELDGDARFELRTLPKDLATRVARHLVMAGRLLDDDPDQAYLHALAGRRLASRVGVVREACGLAAYHAGKWAEALAELRAARRLPGREDAYLPVMADCERGLGRPERALELARSPEAKGLDSMDRVELRIVESGARRDLGQYEAAVVTLQIPELKDRRLRPWSARLFYAYADALVDADREGDARDWFARAAAADRDGETDAAERYADLEGLEIYDTVDDEEPEVTGGSVTMLDTEQTEGGDLPAVPDTARAEPEGLPAVPATGAEGEEPSAVPDAERAGADIPGTEGTEAAAEAETAADEQGEPAQDPALGLEFRGVETGPAPEKVHDVGDAALVVPFQDAPPERLAE